LDSATAGHKGGPWMRRGMQARFEKMSPEERERFKEQMRERCGQWGRHRGHWDWDRPAESPAKPTEDTSKPAGINFKRFCPIWALPIVIRL